MDDVVRILQTSGLFKALNQAELEQLARSVDAVELPAGWELIREGDIGDDLFIVVDGSLQVYTTTQDGQEVVLAKCKTGQYVGEQALLPGGQRKRNASVRTYERTTVLRIHKHDFQKALAKDSPLREQLISAGEEQMKENLLKQSALFRALRFEDSEEWHREDTFADQTVIFSQGDAGDDYYFILEGTVGIYQETDGEKRLLAQLDEGQGFGELALLKQTPRRASAVAQGEVKVLRIDGEVFRDLYRRTPELRGYIQTLQKVYPLANQGFITQHTGKFMDMDSVTTMFHLKNGRTAMSSQVIGRDVFSMSFLNESQEDWRKVHYQDAAQHIERELLLDGDLIVGVTSFGLWEELGRVHHMILTQSPITPEQLSTFQQEGRLLAEKGLIYADADIVCDCLQVDYGTILQAMRQGAENVDHIADRLGCSTVCGSCKPQIREIMGESGWTPVLVTEEYEVVPGIRSFRFEPCGRPLTSAKPGQHIVIKAPIDGVWVQRPYTISSGSTELGYREVTIKREPHGYFSGWIHGNRDPGIVLQISDPQGDYFVDLDEPDPIVCFVAGIGMTPALSILRTMIAEGHEHALYIDYSARTSDEFVYRDEMQAGADAHPQIEVRFRATIDDGRISQQDVSAIMQQYPRARVYICGPGPYQNAVEGYLLASGVPADRINIEEFVPVGGAPTRQTTGELLSSRLYAVVGALLLIAFVLQYALGLEWSWLEDLQAGETFKRWSGVVLVGFIALQWVLPYLRWRGHLKAAARQYHLHKLQGAISPLLFYIHSTALGYAYTFALSLVFFANFALGLVNQEMIPESRYKKLYAQYWLSTHIVLSTSMISLIVYHIYVVFAYK